MRFDTKDGTLQDAETEGPNKSQSTFYDLHGALSTSDWENEAVSLRLWFKGEMPLRCRFIWLKHSDANEWIDLILFASQKWFFFFLKFKSNPFDAVMIKGFCENLYPLFNTFFNLIN